MLMLNQEALTPPTTFRPDSFFIDMGLVRGGFRVQPCSFRVAVAVTGHDFGPAAGGVDLHDVCNRLGITRIVGDNDPLGNVGCDGVVLH